MTRDEFQGRKRPAGTPDLALDRVLWNLRAGFGSRYANWAPTIGKNRPVGHVAGPMSAKAGVEDAGEVSYGGGGAPRAVAAEPAWAKQREEGPGSGVTVGVVDTSIRPHKYLSGAWVARYDDSSWDSQAPMAEAGHSTFISGLVLQYAPGATLHLRRLLGDDGRADSWKAATEIVEAGRSGVDVLNLSFVCYTEDGEAPLVLAAAVDRLDPDIVVVAAAGNHGSLTDGRERTPAWPAALDDVLAVGASKRDRELEPARYTPPGPWVDALAPGDEVQSTYLDGDVQVWHERTVGNGSAGGTRYVERFGGFAEWSGTSFAAAVVSGAIARRTVPGKVSAPEARDELLREAREAQARRGQPAHPLYLPAAALRR
jgi:hypothetical protein